MATRLEQATALLQWWDATNPPEDRDSRLANDTRDWLAGEDVDIPAVTDIVT